jgi:hypothetical protein
MKEERLDLWAIHKQGIPIAITTNGGVRRDGACVMGRGIAFQAKTLYPGFPFIVGKLINEGGNHAYIVNIPGSPAPLITLPVKHYWSDEADLELIARSVMELVELTDHFNRIYLPRPGCGNGRLTWETVRPVIEPFLDNRFTVCTI